MVLVGYRYSPPDPTRYTPPGPPSSHPPGYTTPGTPPSWAYCSAGAARLNSAVGLISVRQVSLSAQISDIRGMTESYNLVRIDRITNHFVIPGNN